MFKKFFGLILLGLTTQAAQLNPSFNSTNNNLVTPTNLYFYNIGITNPSLVTNLTSFVLWARTNTSSGGGSSTNASLFPLGPYAGPTKIILDTDPGCDCDDMSDIDIAFKFQMQGELEILAITSPIAQNWNVANIEAQMRYEGYPNIPVGYATNSSITASNVNVACNAYGSFVQANYYNSVGNITNAPNATTVWRKVLAAQNTTNSVTIVILGNLRNLYNLYNSIADDYSTLTGAELIAAKVKEIVVVAGIFPSGTEYNIFSDQAAADVLPLITDVPVVYAGIEMAGNPPTENIVVGGDVLDLSAFNPAREAYRLFNGGVARQAWGGLGLLYAARGTNYRGTNLFTKTPGLISLSGGNNSWLATPEVQNYLDTVQVDAYYSTLLDDLFMQIPVIRTDSVNSGLGRFDTGDATEPSISGVGDPDTGFNFGQPYADIWITGDGEHNESFWQQGLIFVYTNAVQFVDTGSDNWGGAIDLSFMRQNSTNFMMLDGDVNSITYAGLSLRQVHPATAPTTNNPSYTLYNDVDTGIMNGQQANEMDFISNKRRIFRIYEDFGGGALLSQGRILGWTADEFGGSAVIGGLASLTNGVKVLSSIDTNTWGLIQAFGLEVGKKNGGNSGFVDFMNIANTNRFRLVSGATGGDYVYTLPIDAPVVGDMLRVSSFIAPDAILDWSPQLTGLGLTNISGTISNNIVAGTNILIVAGANGQLTINNSASAGGTSVYVGSSSISNPSFQSDQFAINTVTNIAFKSAAPITNVVNSGTVALTDAATIATDASLGHTFRVTLGGNRTLGNPTNGKDGQSATWELIQDGTGSRTITMDTKFAFGTDITGITLTTTLNKRDFLTAKYNSTADKWYVVGFVRGY